MKNKLVILICITILLLSLLSINAYSMELEQNLGTSTSSQQSYIGTASVGNVSAFNFTASDNYHLKTIEVYIANYNHINFTTWVALYSSSSGQLGSKISDLSTNITNYSVGNYVNYTFPVAYPLTSGQSYWLVFFTNESTDALNNGRYYRVGETLGTIGGLWARGDFLSGITYNANGGSNIVKTANIRLYSSNDYLNVNYVNPSISGEMQTIYLNITNKTGTSNTLNQVNVTLNYNNTIYNMTQLFKNDTSAGFYYTLTNGIYTNNQIINFSFLYSINDNIYLSETYTQNIYAILPLNLTNQLCSTLGIAFNLYDEGNLSSIIGTMQYNFKYGITNNTQITTSGTITNSTLYLCFNSSISSTFYIGQGEIFYSAPGYSARRYYLFNNYTLTANQNNISLYDLINGDATAFQLSVTDTSGNGLVGLYTTLLRWYPNLNSYNVVDIGQTDNLGNTIIYVKVQDIDYRIGVYYPNGSLINLANPIRMVCLSSPCSYTLRLGEDAVDYYGQLTIDYLFTYNYTTGIWNFVYSDRTQRTQNMNMTIYRLAGDNQNLICNSITNGFTGSLVCNTSLYSGTLKGVVVRSASPGIPIAQQILNTIEPAGLGTWGLWLSILIAIPLIMLFSYISPYGALIGGVVALIPALIFNSVNLGVVGAFAILAGIIAHFIKQVS